MNNLYLSFPFSFWQDSEKFSLEFLIETPTSKSSLAARYSIRQHSINSILIAAKTLLVTNLLNYNVNEALVEKEL